MLLVAFLSCLFSSVIFIFFFIKVSNQLLQKRPSLSRLSNRGVPRLGGIAIFMATLFGGFLVNLWWRGIPLDGFIGIFAGGALVLLLGFLDDVKEFSPYIKLTGQLCAVVILLAFGIRTRIYFIPVWLNFVVTGLWILGIINAFNLLDILDGLAGGFAVIISFTFLLLGALTNNFLVSLYAVCLTGAVLGFLFYNFPPARVFMGDSGCMFIGFVLSGLAISVSYAPQTGKEVALLAPILILGVPIYDLLFLSVMRFRGGKSIIRKSQDHLALRIMKMGLGEKKTLFVMYSLCGLFCICGILVTRFSLFGSAIILALTVLSLFIISHKASRVKV